MRADGTWKEEAQIVKQTRQGEEGEEGVEPSWRLSWSTGDLFGAMVHFWRSWGHLGARLGYLGALLGGLESSWGSFGGLGALLGRSWGSLGALLAALEALLGPSWRPSIKRRGVADLGPFVAAFRIAS